MITTVTGLLILSAFVVCIASAMGKAPLWVAVLLMLVADLLHFIPLG